MAWCSLDFRERKAGFDRMGRWDFSGLDLSDPADVAEITEAMRNARVPPHSLFLGQVDLSDGGVQAVADYLEQDKAMTVIHLGDNSISTEGTRVLFEALERNPDCRLRQFWFKSNAFDLEGVAAVARYLAGTGSVENLHCLDLWNNGLGAEGTRILADGLASNTSLRRLYLGCNSIGVWGSPYVARIIRECVGLTSISVDMNGLGDDGLEVVTEALADASQVTRACLKYNNLTPAGMERICVHLQNNSVIQSLILGHVEALETMTEVMHLPADQIAAQVNVIGSRGMAALADVIADPARCDLSNLCIAHAQPLAGDNPEDPNDRAGLMAFVAALEANTKIFSVVSAEFPDDLAAQTSDLLRRNRTDSGYSINAPADTAEIRTYSPLDTLDHYKRTQARIELEDLREDLEERSLTFRSYKVERKEIHRDLEDQRDPDFYDEDESAALRARLETVNALYRDLQQELGQMRVEEKRLNRLVCEPRRGVKFNNEWHPVGYSQNQGDTPDAGQGSAATDGASSGGSNEPGTASENPTA